MTRLLLRSTGLLLIETRRRSIHTTKGERLRVAIVGAGCAGMASALHLAPLVERGQLESIDLYSCPSPQRSIGVGIWSTALQSFAGSDRASHQLVYDEMMRLGTWVGPQVGYRVPSGPWLLTSRLPTSLEESLTENKPALLFLREQDMLHSLRKAVHWEERQGTLTVHCQESSGRVTGLKEDSSQPWSTNLLLGNQQQETPRDYHLIVAADGTNSMLRTTYGGYDNDSQVMKTGGVLLSGTPTDLPTAPLSPLAWNEAQQQEAVSVQDRNYTVFRGNARISQQELAGSEHAKEGVSFQTWGEGRNMRFATVSMQSPAGEEQQVWFITIDDDAIASEPDPAKRQALLLETFSNWHEEVCQIVQATPPEEILMERAVAHRHCMGPVLNVNGIIEKIRGKRPPSSGDGPCLVFIGDAYMTVDPILAQGFTVAFESAYGLRHSIEQSCVPFEKDPSYAFDPYKLRRELRTRHDLRTNRIVALLRATELVQALGQPTGTAGRLNTKLLRPFLRLLPNAIKRPIFDAVLKYSLGLSPSGRRHYCMKVDLVQKG